MMSAQEATAAILTVLSILTGFPLGESLNKDQQEQLQQKPKKEPQHDSLDSLKRPWVLLYTLTLPFAMVALSYSVDLSSGYRTCAWLLTTVLTPGLSYIHWHPAILFGIRGSAIALLAMLSLWSVLQKVEDMARQDVGVIMKWGLAITY